MLKSSTTLQNEQIRTLAIGGFDGIHRGHQALLSRLESDGALLVVDKGFSPALTPGGARCRHTRHPCFFLDFEAIRDLEAEQFIDRLKETFPALRKIVVGYDFRFGKGRRGDVALLRERSGLEVEVIEEQSLDGVSIHAATIRRLIAEGKIEKANRLLGRPYSVEGKIVKGQGLGKKALYPTFNLDTGDFLLPAEGVYISTVRIGEARYPSVTFVGKRLSTDAAFSVETHVLSHLPEGSEPKEAEIFFMKFLRHNKRFDTLSALKKQIGEDILRAKAFFQGTM